MQRIGFEQLELNPFTVVGDENFLLTSGQGSEWNTMTAGWGGFGYLWNDPVAFVFVRQERHTLSFMERFPRFSLSFFPPERKDVLDYCGRVSGRDCDKAAGARITPIAIDGTVAFAESNLVMTCEKVASTVLSKDSLIDASLLRLYPQEDWHTMYIGRILGAYIS